MNRIKYILVIFLGLKPVCDIKAQDIHFAQYDKAPMMLNPGLTGALYFTEATLNYRTQWSSVEAPFKTYAFTFNQRLTKKRRATNFIAIGISAFHDNAGTANVKTSDLKLSISGQLKVSEYSSLGLGIQSGLLQKRVDATGLQWGSQFDGGGFNPGIQNLEGAYDYGFGTFDAAAGIVYRYNQNDFIKVTGNNEKSFNAGFSVFHVSKPRYALNSFTERLPMKFVLYANSIWGLENSNWAIGPSFLYQYQNKAQEFVAGCRFRYMLQQASKFTGFKAEGAASVGVYMRSRDALIALLQYEFSNYSIGLSYDINVSKLAMASNARGGFEISIRFVSPNPFNSNMASW